jgi:hypothetical protein
MKALKLANPTRLHLAPTLLLLLLCPTAAVGQAVPDNIPDVPGESPVDRWRERVEERYHSTLSRFSTSGSFDMGPVTGAGAAYPPTSTWGCTFAAATRSSGSPALAERRPTSTASRRFVAVSPCETTVSGTS